ncbi:hypothetical protein VOLCADRAFT_98831 [Volvox carteri f. nagariensis]|uniref:C-type lectin domain-containing protein n=1 Tax=Volvox carteri f. nagariensis TaxID=3068 RepID=D8UGE0_VOLCA|nr:uncharacterized protein VOLCADRAFT_98831 [Volvox carteri f. nagariensis]EFJ41158.1 hypothetical protein VOLCADRAFT_98831 [Volvox carteri f. nagariensis]|eukprot:XP_002957726.1 hypothetical protein VOLCADRAFT_98831 [Volvox carteri f. nagariensis]
MCQSPNITIYEACPPPPAPPPSPGTTAAPPPPPPTCDPNTFSYVTISYTCPYEGRTYTLYDVNAGCMPDWNTSKTFCENRGMELAPWDSDASNGALQNLCTSNKFTCWADGNKPAGLCPLLSQEGAVLFQTCDQRVRFVCRTTIYKRPSPPPPPPSCNPYTAPYRTQTYINPIDCKNYTLYDTAALCMADWYSARDFCGSKGLELVPYTEDAGMSGLTRLCSQNSFTCWTGAKSDTEFCPLMTASGQIVQQSCQQSVRWDCKTYTLYDMDAVCMTDWYTAGDICDSQGLELVPYTEDAGRAGLSELCCSQNSFTCWTGAKSDTDFCPLMTASGQIVQQSCQQSVRWVCRTTDSKCPPSPLPPPPPPPSPEPPPPPATARDNVLTLMDAGFEYRMYTVDAKQRLTHSGAAAYCGGLGAGWDLVPYTDNTGYDAVRRLCAANQFTCWLKRADSDQYCPLMAADGTLQMQGCQQDVRFVCRRPRQIA